MLLSLAADLVGVLVSCFTSLGRLEGSMRFAKGAQDGSGLTVCHLVSFLKALSLEFGPLQAQVSVSTGGIALLCISMLWNSPSPKLLHAPDEHAFTKHARSQSRLVHAHLHTHDLQVLPSPARWQHHWKGTMPMACTVTAGAS